MKRQRHNHPMAGFTLVEALLATLLMGIILTALGALTAQWLPNWNRGFVRVQRAELLTSGLERLVSDLAAAETVPVARGSKQPFFDGSELSVTFVRTAIGPNTSPGLEIVRIVESADTRGLNLVRTAAPFMPAEPGASAPPNFRNPVVVIRPPYRAVFSYAGRDRIWRPTWQDARELPHAVRISLRDADGRPLGISASTDIHVQVPARCVTSPDDRECGSAPPRAQTKPDEQAVAPQPLTSSGTIAR